MTFSRPLRLNYNFPLYIFLKVRSSLPKSHILYNTKGGKKREEEATGQEDRRCAIFSRALIEPVRGDVNE